MRLLPVTLLAALALAPVTGWASPAPATSQDMSLESVVLMHVDGDVTIEPDGSVGDIAFKTKFDEALRTSLEAKMRAWKFKPVQIAGQARRAQTPFRVMLAAEKVEDHYRVRIDATSFGGYVTPETIAHATVPDGVAPPITAGKLGAPQYPMNEMLAGRIGTVHLVIRVSPDGRTADVAATQSLVYDIGGRQSDRDARRSIRAFEAAAIAAARKWTFNVPAGAATRKPGDMTVATDVVYVIKYDTEVAGQWVPVKRAPKRPIAWLPPEQSDAGGVGMAAGGQVVGIESPYQLQQSADGTPVM